MAEDKKASTPQNPPPQSSSVPKPTPAPIPSEPRMVCDSATTLKKLSVFALV